MSIYLKARNKGGMSVPWVWTRRLVARRWGCLPREVDEEPVDEVMLELRLIEMEAEAEEARG